MCSNGPCAGCTASRLLARATWWRARLPFRRSPRLGPSAAIVYRSGMTDQPSAGRFEGRVHFLPARVYYEDTDFTGVVYHANYLRYFERGRSDFLRAAGIHHTELLNAAEPMGFAVNKISLEFLKAARIDDALVVETAF